MLGKLFPGARVRAVAKMVDQAINMALQFQEATGSSPHLFFLNHPMTVNHNVIDQSVDGKVHEFYIAGSDPDLHVMAHEGTLSFVVVMPQGEFLGATIQASQEGQYSVRLDRPLSQPVGKLAHRLLDEFIKVYDASDLMV